MLGRLLRLHLLILLLRLLLLLLLHCWGINCVLILLLHVLLLCWSINCVLILLLRLLHVLHAWQGCECQPPDQHRLFPCAGCERNP